ncbi:TPA: hypothetical protein ACS5MP_004681 [Salmonella enterica subsp. enterica]|nr:hypothetical protein [Salmonella enterica subsp. enterica serovar Schwarzengrund]ECJ7326423.1 hypothetical protein [Salmonella enterica subsp. enterica serovar Schwarzengrund]
MDESRRQREEFEKWWSEEGWDKKLSNVQGLMFNRIKTGMFTAWLASRAAIEIELPESIIGDNGDGEPWRWMYASEVEDAIRAAGIKGKE